MKLIGSHQILCLLGDDAVLRRKQFRTHRGIQYIQKNCL